MKNLNQVRFLAVVVIALGLSACAHRVNLLSTPAVSMTENSFESTYKAKEAGAVTAKYCTGDDAQSSSSKGTSQIGLMDEVIHKAQEQSGARYISNAQFFGEGSCVVLEGTAMK